MKKEDARVKRPMRFTKSELRAAVVVARESNMSVCLKIDGVEVFFSTPTEGSDLRLAPSAPAHQGAAEFEWPERTQGCKTP